MANNAKGLGKGLAALLGDNVMDTSEEKSSLYPPIMFFYYWKYST